MDAKFLSNENKNNKNVDSSQKEEIILQLDSQPNESEENTVSTSEISSNDNDGNLSHTTVLVPIKVLKNIFLSQFKYIFGLSCTNIHYLSPCELRGLIILSLCMFHFSYLGLSVTTITPTKQKISKVLRRSGLN